MSSKRHDDGICDPATGRPRVLAQMCATCVFRPGNVMRLQPGRLKVMVDESVANGAWITCHETLPYGIHPDAEQAICRGFYETHGHRSWGVRLAEALGGLVEVDPPG